MSDKPKKGGRRVMVAGQTLSDEDSVPPPPPKPLLRLDNADEEIDAPQTYNAQRVRQFIEGRITLGELEGITKAQQYELAQLGHQALSQGKLERALTVFKALVALDGYDAYFHLGLASAHHLNEDTKAAEYHYGEAIRFNPFLSPAYAHRGELRVMQGKLHEGAVDLLKTVELDPDAVNPATQRARATLLVLKEQLGAMSPEDMERLALEATGSKVSAVRDALPKEPGAKPRPRGARPRRAQPRARGPAPRKKPR